MSKKKLAETLRKLEEKYGLDPPIEEGPELTMMENPYLTWASYEQIEKTGQPWAAGAVRQALESYAIPHGGGDPLDYLIQMEEEEHADDDA